MSGINIHRLASSSKNIEIIYDGEKKQPHTRKLLNLSGSRKRVKGSSSVASIFFIAISAYKYSTMI